ncbi:MAG: AAA family ATPase [Pirellulales bacterium]
MKISEIHVEGFGVWRELKLDRLAEDMTLVHGPNEAGKTTLMQFIRTVLYGVSPERSRRYLPPLDGGRAGGSLRVSTAAGDLTFSRYPQDGDQASPLQIRDADGAAHSADAIDRALVEIDEAIFNNVFAIGLHELQELNSLSDSQAANWLFGLTAGLDRVSLVEVMHELQNSLARLIAPDDRSSQLTDLAARRESLQAEIQQLSTQTWKWSRLAAERQGLDRQIDELETVSARLQREIRSLELASAVRTTWQRRADLDQQLTTAGAGLDWPQDYLARLDRLEQSLAKHRHQKRELIGQFRDLRRQAGTLSVNETLWKQAPRIEALGDHQSWLESCETQVTSLREEVERLRVQRDSQRGELEISPEQFSELVKTTGRTYDALRRSARSVQEARQAWHAARSQAGRQRQAASDSASRVEARMAARSEADLSAALERVGGQVAQLRRRIQVDQHLEQLERRRGELHEQTSSLLVRQLTPTWILAGLGTMFVLGVTMLLAGLWMPASIVGTLGGTLVFFGISGTVAAAVAKLVLDRSAAKNVQAAQHQSELLERQLAQVQNERHQLDAQLPSGGGPLAVRLKAAEQELATLEELLPLDAQRQLDAKQAAAAETLADQRRSEYRAARRQWRQTLVHHHLPTSLSPKQVRSIASRARIWAEVDDQLQRRERDLHERSREYDSIAARVRQLASDAGSNVPEGATAMELLRVLLQELQREEATLAQKTELRQQARQLRRRIAKHDRRMAQLAHRRAMLFTEAGVSSPEEFRQQALHAAHLATLRQERAACCREIENALGGHFAEEEIAAHLTAGEAEDLDQRWEQLSAKLDSTAGSLKEQVERRGALRRELEELAEDRRLGEKQLELSIVQQRLREGIRQWQTRATLWLFLDLVRRDYEKNRQPQTLVEASGYLRELTGGRYTRVWTPIDEAALYVDDARGESLSLTVLSRGTREQLFLSLRLALVAMYARRGVRLPLILDDVLVNFDTRRAKSAARVLRAFAKQDHQILVFTCHDHVVKLFKSLKVDVRKLPDRETTGDEVPPRKQKAAKKPQPARKKRRVEKPVEVRTERKPEPVPQEVKVAAEPEPVKARRPIPVEYLDAFVSGRTDEQLLIDDEHEADEANIRLARREAPDEFEEDEDLVEDADEQDADEVDEEKQAEDDEEEEADEYEEDEYEEDEWEDEAGDEEERDEDDDHEEDELDEEDLDEEELDDEEYEDDEDDAEAA